MNPGTKSTPLCSAIGQWTGITSLFTSSMLGQGGYGVGGILSWLCSIGCAARYRSTGKVESALAIAVGVGFALGLITAFIAPWLVSMRYGS